MPDRYVLKTEENIQSSLDRARRGSPCKQQEKLDQFVSSGYTPEKDPGGVAERLNAAVLKTVDVVRRPGVQIPPPPPDE